MTPSSGEMEKCRTVLLHVLIKLITQKQFVRSCFKYSYNISNFSKIKAPFIHTGQIPNTGNGLFGDTKVIIAKSHTLPLLLFPNSVQWFP